MNSSAEDVDIIGKSKQVKMGCGYHTEDTLVGVRKNDMKEGDVR